MGNYVMFSRCLAPDDCYACELPPTTEESGGSDCFYFETYGLNKLLSLTVEKKEWSSYTVRSTVQCDHGVRGKLQIILARAWHDYTIFEKVVQARSLQLFINGKSMQEHFKCASK